MDQRMGRAAQDAFKLQCSSEGITCNPSLEDDYGWDFLVEIPQEVAAGTPHDKRPAARSVLVQVKWTGGSRRRLSMKVSNALELANKAEPCVLVLYHETSSGQRIFARMFGKEDMARSLKRGRELFVDRKPTHKARMTFGFADTEERSETDLVPWLVDCVRHLPDSYGSDKRNLAKSLGYGNKNWRANITFVGKGGVDDLVDLELGIKDELRVSRFTVFDERFGIALPEPVKDIEEPAIFTMKSQHEVECAVTLETKDRLMVVPSVARMSVAGARSPDLGKLAFVNDLFALVVSTGSGVELKLRAKGATKLGLERLAQLATMLSWNEEEVKMRVTGENTPETVFPLAIIRQNPKLDPRVSAAIGLLNTVAKRSNKGGMELSLDEVISAHGELMVFWSILSAAEVQLHTEADERLLEDGLLRNLLGFIDVEVGDHTFLALFDAAVETHIEEPRRLVVELGSRNLRDCVVGEGRETVRAKGRAIYEQCGGGYGEDWLAIGSVNALIESNAKERVRGT